MDRERGFLPRLRDSLLRRRSCVSTDANQASDKVCRICLSGGKLIEPCGCRGSQAFVHEECLLKWRASGWFIRDKCELCGLSYVVPAPLGWFLRSMHLLALSAMLELSVVVVHVILEARGEVLPPSKNCFWLSRVWRDAVGKLFLLCDTDHDNGLSVSEMRGMANKTGELQVRNMTDEMLSRVIQFFNHNEHGLTVEGLISTYEFGGNSTESVLQDLITYGLLGELQRDLNYHNLSAVVGLLLVAALMVHRVTSTSFTQFMFSFLFAMFLTPWKCTYYVTLICFGGITSLAIPLGGKYLLDEPDLLVDQQHVSSYKFLLLAKLFLFLASLVLTKIRL